MIFTNIDSDSDKIISKIGILGKSFDQLGISIQQRKSDIKDLMDTMSKQDAKRQVGGIFSYLFGDNSIKNKPYNLDLFKVLDENGASKLLDTLKEWDTGVKNNTKSWDKYFDGFSEGEKWQTKFIQNNDLQKTSIDDLIKASQDARTAAIAHNAAIKQQTLSAKAGQVALKGLAVVGNALASFGMAFVASKAISFIYEMATANDKLLENAKELTSEFKKTESSIEDYKKKISELHNTINDSSASIADTTKARQDLMAIQDELIQKYGTEKGTIETITNAINDEADALDNLSKKQYLQWKNKFNDKSYGKAAIDFLGSGNISEAAYAITGFDFTGAWDALTKPTKDNISNMVESMHSAYYELEKTGNEALDNLIKKSFSLKENYDGSKFVMFGNLNDVYDDLISIQDMSSNFTVSDSFKSSITKISNAMDKTLTSYKDAFDTYILYEKILTASPDNQYDTQFSAINDAKELYNDAFQSGNQAEIDDAAKNYASVLSSAMTLAMENNDGDVAKYFENMYPDLQQLVGEWKFDVNFEPNADGLKEKVQNALNGLDGYSTEDILNLNPAIATEEEQKSYAALINLAEEYGLTLDQLILKLEKEKLVESASTQESKRKFGSKINELSEEDQRIVAELPISNIKSWDDLLQKIQEYKDSLADSDKIAFTISEEQKKSLDSAQSSIKTLDDALEKIDSKELEPDSLVKLTSEFPELLQYISSGTDDMFALQNAIDQIKSDKVNKLKSELAMAATTATEETKPAIYALIQLIDSAFPDRPTGILNGLEDAVGDAIELQESFGIVNEAITSKLPLQDEMITHLISLYPSLEDAIYRTVDGWYLEESAIDVLSGKMGDLQSSYLDAQKRMTELLSSGVGTRLKMLDIELTGITNMAKAYETISNLNQIPRNSVDAEGNPEVDLSDFNSIRETILLQGQMAELLAQFDTLNKSGLSSAKSSKKTEKKEKDPKTQTYDLVERRKNNLEKEHDKIEEMVNDENISYENQIGLLTDLIELDNKRSQFSKDAAKNYEQDWLKAQESIRQAVSGSDYNFDDIINYIREGDERIREFTGDDIVDSIDAGIDAWDKLNENEEYSEKLQKEINEHLEKQRQLRLDLAKAQTDEIAAKASKLQSEIDLIEAKGGIVNEDMLRRQIRMSEELEGSHRNRISALEEMLDSVEPLSAEYYSLKSEIEGCENEIIQCQIEQAKWNEEILNIPVRRIERYIELLANIKKDLTNFIDVQNASGKETTLDQYQELIGLTNEQIDSLMKKHEELQNKLSHFKYGSDKFNEVQADLQDVEDEISSLIQTTKEWINEILNIPINNIQKVNTELSNIVSSMGDILSDYDTAISAVTGTIDKQIDSINKLADATSKEYQDKIDPLQDELDLLQKQNEARKIQLELEQARYDLERAKNQKTNKVVRNGELVYEADQEALRAANAAIADAEYNKTIHDLEGQIKSLEEQRDKLLEGYDQQIEKLDEIKDRWSQIASDVQLTIDSLTADELFGKGWQDKILSGEDTDIYKVMKDWYSSLSTQQHQYEQQIESNERIADLMEQFVTLYQDGSITYEQAMAGIQNLTAQMGNGFTALENLNALLQVGGANSLSSMLDKAQENATQSVSQMSDYLKAVKENSDALADYVMTWDEMKQNIKDQVEALKAAAEALKNKPVSRPSNDDDDDDDDDGGYRGPTDTYVNGEYVHTNDGWGNYYDKNTGDKVEDPGKNLNDILEKHKKHDGIESGLIGNSDAAREKMLKSLTTDGLKPNETISKLLVGEAVLTKEQQEQLLKNFSLASRAVPPVISVPEVVNANDSKPNIEITMGNIVLQGVQDPDGLAKAIKRDFPGIMRQEIHKR